MNSDMDFNTLLDQLEVNRPDLSDSLTLLRQYQKNTEQSVVKAPEVESDILQRFKEQQMENQRLLQNYNQLETNYFILERYLRELAEAIGSCPHCFWGEDTECKYCKGKGRPGYFLPNEQHFNTYVKPIILRLKSLKNQTI
jgi:hypothetical protein